MPHDDQPPSKAPPDPAADRPLFYRPHHTYRVQRGLEALVDLAQRHGSNELHASTLADVKVACTWIALLGQWRKAKGKPSE